MIGAIGLSSRQPKKKKSNVLDRELTLRAQSRVQEAKLVFGSDDDTHPGVKHLFNVAKDFYVGGKLEAISRLEHYDFLDLRCMFHSASRNTYTCKVERANH